MDSSSRSIARGRGGRTATSPRVTGSSKFRPVHPPYQNHRPDYEANCHWAPVPSKPFQRKNFTVELRSDHRKFQKADIEGFIANYKSKPDNVKIFNSGPVAGSLFFQRWADASDAVVYLWKARLNGDHSFTPRLVSTVLVQSDIYDLSDQLKTLFTAHVRGLIEGDPVKKWQNIMNALSDDIAKISPLLKKHNKISVFEELNKKREGLKSERELILRRLKEFKAAMNCIIDHVEGTTTSEKGCELIDLFQFHDDLNWKRIHHLIKRECQRLEDGLPMYAYRQEILRHISSNQVMVLNGETGSGKSTQLVQFLADSGVTGNKSIICTQPRKIAAISLARRVEEESHGCYEDSSITCYPTYSSFQAFDSKVVFMTDHCLLQHYMNDTNLSVVSCIIIDEAHERSLNTDLLLALVKNLLHRRPELRLIIMSATADSDQLSEYFCCLAFHVLGRTFPVDIKYAPCDTEVVSSTSKHPYYVSSVIRMATEIHRTEKEGTILAFLTSQMEVEYACENFKAPASIALPLHGKLSHEEQLNVFKNYPGTRKVIFATNLAETSLTIPGVKYVIDSGMVKQSKFEPGTGMNVLRVSQVSQSSANQRAGRAGRTEPGICYRLYSQCDFESMPPHQEPEIRRVHLGVAVLKILALGIKDVQGFDFVDAPSPESIKMAVRNLIHLGAITLEDKFYVLTKEGQDLVKLGIEPRLGKLILGCFQYGLKREGLVLAAVLANSSTIFCRVGTEDEKLKSDCLKVHFCHRNGDLFTLLSVYKEWEGIAREKRNKWCWENSINAKSMRRCEETILELEQCLKNELSRIIPSFWLWKPSVSTEHDINLKKAILSSLPENVAVYSGCNQLGYEVALTGQHVQLHPSCSLLIFNQKPSWVVFGEILSISNEFLVCVTAFDSESLSTLCPPPPFDVTEMENRKIVVKKIDGFLGSTLLKRFCGKNNNSLLQLISRIQRICSDNRIRIKVDVDQKEIQLFAPSENMEMVSTQVNDVLHHETKWLHNECLEKCLYHVRAGSSPPVALFGSGAEIKHLELNKRCLAVDLSLHSETSDVDDKELLMFIEKFSPGISSVQKRTIIGQSSEEENHKWGRITFLTPASAENASELNGVDFGGSTLKMVPSKTNYMGGDPKMYTFPAVRAKVCWPRRLSKGFGVLKCARYDMEAMIDDFSGLLIGDRPVRCEVSRKYLDNLLIMGIDKSLSEGEVVDVLRSATQRRVLDFFLVRGDVVENPPIRSCEEALTREISAFMPRKNPHSNSCRVQIYPPELKDHFMRAVITFDGRLHLEAARALEEIEGKVLPGFLPWQKIKCQRMFQTSVSCPAPVYSVIKRQLDCLLPSLNRRKGAECNLERNENGSYRVRISANATKTVAELRHLLEQLMKGKTVDDARLTPTIVQLLFSRDGMSLMRSIQRDTGTYIFFDRQNVSIRIFGPIDRISIAENNLARSLLALHENKQLEIHLRGDVHPADLMKEVVEKFGPDLHGLKEQVPGADFTLNARRQVITLRGNRELKQKAEEIVYKIAHSNGHMIEKMDNPASICPICLCEVEDEYRLEGCGHLFCLSCLLEQCDSVIKSHEGFPMRCTQENCNALILLTDLRSLLSADKLEDLFRASLGAFVASSAGTYRYCPTPDCPSVYRNASSDPYSDSLFSCGACYVDTCTKCHMEYHSGLTCEKYQEYKKDPDLSLKEWTSGKENVKRCPVCGYTIEKVDGCNHVECKCGKHICWACLDVYQTSEDCYNHMRSVHQDIN